MPRHENKARGGLGGTGSRFGGTCTSGGSIRSGSFDTLQERHILGKHSLLFLCRNGHLLLLLAGSLKCQLQVFHFLGSLDGAVVAVAAATVATVAAATVGRVGRVGRGGMMALVTGKEIPCTKVKGTGSSRHLSA